MSLDSSAPSAADNPVWIPVSRAACRGDFHIETAQSQVGDSYQDDVLLDISQ